MQEIPSSSEPSGPTTRAAEDVTTTGESVQLADLVTKNSIVAVAAEDDSHYDYYLLKITCDGVTRLEDNFKDPYGNIYKKGQSVLQGKFFLRENIIDQTYKLDEKVAAVFPGTVRYICAAFISKGKKQPIFQVPLDEHEQILAFL